MEKFMLWAERVLPQAIGFNTPEGYLIAVPYTKFYEMYGEEIDAAISEGKTDQEVLKVIEAVDAEINYGWSYYTKSLEMDETSQQKGE